MVDIGLDPVVISKLTSDQVEQVTCIECCRFYIAPETAACGHTLCHACWKSRRVCHTCAASIDRKALKLNLPLQTLTEHVHALAGAFEKLFNVKLDEFSLEFLDDLQSEDPTKHVKEWLANSENQFSAPITVSQISEPGFPQHMELAKNKIQIHVPKNITKSPDKIVKPPQPQEDWDKIEVLPDTEEVHKKPKDHVIGPKDFEPIFIDGNEYTNNNPRRSSRKRELKEDSNHPTSDILSAEKNSAKNSSIETKSLKNKQTWNSVKKMRKEFSKLNKKNRSKLNVSIEMCKKAQKNPKQAQTIIQTDSEQMNIIQDNTPQHLKDDHKNEKSFSNASNTVKNTCLEEEPTEVLDKQNSITLGKYKNTDKNSPKIVPDLNMNQIKDSKIPKQSYTSNYMPFIKKSALHHKSVLAVDNHVQVTQKEVETDKEKSDTGDIEISIKIRNTITHIVINNKKRDIQMKLNTDKEIQTSLGQYSLVDKNNVGCSPIRGVEVQNIDLNVDKNNKVTIDRTISTKKNTASADTAPVNSVAQFEITDSIEKELSDVMEKLEHKRNRTGVSQKITNSTKVPIISNQSPVASIKKQYSVVTEQPEDKTIEGHVELSQKKDADSSGKNNELPTDMEEDLNDIDIFNSGSIKASNVELLRDTEAVTSDIIMPTIKSKKSYKVANKREREINNDIELPCSKKHKKCSHNIVNDKEKEIPFVVASEELHKESINDSEPMNYDAIMSQVFANIDAEIQNGGHNVENRQTLKLKDNESSGQVTGKDVQLQTSQIIHKTQTKVSQKHAPTAEVEIHSNLKEEDQKYSENVFSVMDKESLAVSGKNNDKLPESSTSHLTPGICQDLATPENNTRVDTNVDDVELIHATPIIDNNDDESVVEETPQKNVSFPKPTKQNVDMLKNIAENQKQLKNQPNSDAKSTDSQIIRSIINISDTSLETSRMKESTVVEMAPNKVSLLTKEHVLETPLTINKFVNHIKHNSTPVARKSLNFDSDQDPEQTLCPTTTQEKEFLSEAFKHTQISPIKRALTLKNIFSRQPKKLCVAGSCLSPAETKNLKMLCSQRNWTYFDKYSDNLTHLVVGVDEENKSQRSVKYMCALAASKWIVSYSWIETCLHSKTIVDELPYEVLDACGEPGPRRSRTAIKKVFEGITFYCMPPFSLLEIDTLKHMLKSAGGQVVEDPQAVKITEENSNRPALLLAEPEHTQEDRFIYFAMEQKVVPVNFEWALNCLGTYTLCSIQDLLLCPFSILPSYVENWPASLVNLENEEE